MAIRETKKLGTAFKSGSGTMPAKAADPVSDMGSRDLPET